MKLRISREKLRELIKREGDHEVGAGMLAMSPKVGKIRAAETAAVTDKVLDEIGMDERLPPKPILYSFIREMAEELGIELTEHEVGYIAETNLKWVFDGIDPELAKKGRDARRKLN